MTPDDDTPDTDLSMDDIASGDPLALNEVYSGGFFTIVDRFERKQRPLTGSADVVPPADTDLNDLWARKLPEPSMPFGEARRFSAERKVLELQEQFVGQPEIFLLHALLIAMLRRNDPPEQVLPLFLRIWAEQGDRLAEALPVRWLISAATTFAEKGQNGTQQACGMGLSVLFDMIKLHDSERRLSGMTGDQPFSKRRYAQQTPLAFDLNGYSFRNGDLDTNLLARLWKMSETDSTIRPLGFRMLRLLMQEDRTIFGRVQALKARFAGNE